MAEVGTATVRIVPDLGGFAALGVMADVLQERQRQDVKWGQQNHPVVRDTHSAVLYGEDADDWKGVNDYRATQGTSSWDGILLEEVYEALAESDPAKCRAELVQVAAVAVAMIESIDRNGMDGAA